MTFLRASILALNKLFRQILIVTIMLITTFIVFPLALSFFLPILAIRKIVSGFSNVIRPDFGKILPCSSSLLAVDYYPKTTHILSIVIRGRIKGSVDIGALKSKLVNEVIGIRKVGEDFKNIEMKQYPYKWMGFFFWKWEEDFDISNHVKYYEGATNSETKLTFEQLADIEFQLVFKRFPEKRSPWQIIIFPNVQSESGEDETVIMNWFHHSLGDGFSLMKLICCDIMDAPKEQIPQLHFLKQNFWQRFLFYLTFLKMPYELAELTLEAPTKNDWMVPRNEISENWIAAFSDKISMDVIKDAASALHSSVSVVILSALTAAIRQSMLKKNGRVPKYIHTALAFPKEGHPDKLRNYALLGLVRLPVGEMDPLLRLRKMENILIKMKNSTLPYSSYVISLIVGSLFYWMLTPFIGKSASQTNATGTTLPGPKTKLSLMGNEAIDCQFSLGPFMAATGVNFGTWTYNNYFKVRFMVNERMLDQKSEVEEMCETMLHEFTVLKGYAKTDV